MLLALATTCINESTPRGGADNRVSGEGRLARTCLFSGSDPENTCSRQKTRVHSCVRCKRALELVEPIPDWRCRNCLWLLFLVRVGLPRLETGEEVNDVPVAQEHGLGIDCVGLLGFGTTVFRRYLQLDIHLFAQTETNRCPLTSLIFL